MTLSDKAAALAQVRRAKFSHVRWRAYAQGLVGGVPVDEERVPVHHTDCQFGQWYYGDGLRQLAAMEAFRKVAAPHERLHRVYAELHALVDRKDLAGANARLSELVTVSRELLDLMDALEAELSAS